MKLLVTLSVALLAIVPAEAVKYPVVEFRDIKDSGAVPVEVPVNGFWSRNGGLKSIETLLKGTALQKENGIMADSVYLRRDVSGFKCIITIPGPEKLKLVITDEKPHAVFSQTEGPIDIGPGSIHCFKAAVGLWPKQANSVA
ncbi:unnamed protein product [Diplocarpon coronariae]